jgi:hypothetical protein
MFKKSITFYKKKPVHSIANDKVARIIFQLSFGKAGMLTFLHRYSRLKQS